MGKTIILSIAIFSLMLIPVSQLSFGTHDTVLPCPADATLLPFLYENRGPGGLCLIEGQEINNAPSQVGESCLCLSENDPGCSPLGVFTPNTNVPPYSTCDFSYTTQGYAEPVYPFTVPESCQDNAILDANNHCVPDLDAICGEGTMISSLQCIALGMQAVGGTYIPIETLAVIAAAVGVDPLITGLVAMTMVGVTAQVAWFVHKREKKQKD